MSDVWETVAGIVTTAIVTIGGGYFAVKKTKVSSNPGSPIKKPTAADELHAIIEVLQNELKETAKRHADEIRSMQARLDDVSDAYDRSVQQHRVLEGRFARAIKEIKRLKSILSRNKIPYGRSYLHEDDSDIDF